MKWFRVFFKLYTAEASEKASAIIELQEKSFKGVYLKCEKMGKKKHMRVVMIAEITKATGLSIKI